MQRKKPKVEKEPPSPWDVISLEVFLHYKCPICVYTCKEEMMFIDHAYEYHEESVVYLCKLTTMNQLDRDDLFDGEEHNDFVEHDDFRWDADSDSCLDNNQPVVECKVEVKEVNDAEDKNFLHGKISEPLDEDLVGSDKEYTPEDSDEDWQESKPKPKKGNKDNVTVSSTYQNCEFATSNTKFFNSFFRISCVKYAKRGWIPQSPSRSNLQTQSSRWWMILWPDFRIARQN